MIANGKFNERQLNERKHPMKIGSGYPSDPICKEWINNDGMVDPIFAFPNIVRFSWAPIKKLIQQKTSPELGGDDAPAIVVPIIFAADIENDDEQNDSEKHKILVGMKRQQEQMNIFLGKNKCSKDKGALVPKRLQYFERRKLQPVTKL